MHRLEEEFNSAARYRVPLAMLMLDVDNFGEFNNSFGHPAGDDMLRTVARVLRETARSTDLPARLGGDEFAVLLTNTDPDGAAISAERVRRAIEVAQWLHRPVTVSIGVAAFPQSAMAAGPLFEAADRALYRAKTKGRNRVEL